MSILEVEGLDAGYGPVRVLHNLTFHVDEGEVVVMLGANGAGKTTTMRALTGLISRRGTVRFAGSILSTRAKTDSVVALGITLVPQGRGTLTDLTVEDNLRVGGLRAKEDVRGDMDRWYGVFPRLRDRRLQKAGSLSGGEQQMLAIARALMSRPRLLLCDEPSLGLAPLITEELFRVLAEVNRDLGTSMLIVEQNANLALEIGQRAYVLEAGEIAASGSASEIQANDAVQRAYLGA